MNIYISGPMTGLPEFNYPAFFEAAKKLEAIGHNPINPADTGVNPAWTWRDYMKESIKMLMDAQGFVTLPGWEGSRGATLEVYVANRLGMQNLTHLL